MRIDRPPVGFTPATTIRAGAAALVLAVTGLANPAEARRTVIDENEFGVSLEVTGDADNGDTTVLPFLVDYGTGLQSDVSLSLVDCCVAPDTTPEVDVGVNFSDSPGDSVFGTLMLPADFGIETAVRLSNDHETSEPLDPVDAASIFEFGVTQPFTFVPGFPTEESGSVGFYTDFAGLVLFQFSDLSSTGVPGDFELLLVCGGLCTNIGFNLNGLEFSSDLFDPASAPAQLISYSLQDGSSSFRFVFRNAAAVPEPASWAMMLLGFGVVGIALRKRRQPSAASIPI
jgi:hypothetical protein